jgi:hypothetical protein
MRGVLRAAAGIAAVSAVLLAGVGTAGAGSHTRSQSDLAEVRAATAKFTDVATAQAAGYGQLVDAAGIACIDNPAGGMGIHYVNLDLVLNPTLDPAKPEVLVYEHDKHGNLRLVAVEYVVFESDWQGNHPPSLFGEHFHRMPGAGESEPQNRYGLPAFYELHVWAWKHNPSGMFEDWNPKASC